MWSPTIMESSSSIASDASSTSSAARSLALVPDNESHTSSLFFDCDEDEEISIHAVNGEDVLSCASPPPSTSPLPTMSSSWQLPSQDTLSGPRLLHLPQPELSMPATTASASALSNSALSSSAPTTTSLATTPSSPPPPPPPPTAPTPARIPGAKLRKKCAKISIALLALIWVFTLFMVCVYFDVRCDLVVIKGHVVDQDSNTHISAPLAPIMDLNRHPRAGALTPDNRCRMWPKYDDLELDMGMKVSETSCRIMPFFALASMMCFTVVLFFPPLYVRCIASFVAISVAICQGLTYTMIPSELCNGTDFTYWDEENQRTIVYDECSLDTLPFKLGLGNIVAWLLTAIMMHHLPHFMPKDPEDRRLSPITGRPPALDTGMVELDRPRDRQEHHDSEQQRRQQRQLQRLRQQRQELEMMQQNPSILKMFQQHDDSDVENATQTDFDTVGISEDSDTIIFMASNYLEAETNTVFEGRVFKGAV